MISLIVEGERLDMAPGTSFTFEFVTGLFDFDSVKGSYSYSFDIPATPPNMMKLGHPDVVAAPADAFRLRSAEIEYFGMPFRRGQFRIQRVRGGGLQCFFVTDAGALAANNGTDIGSLVDISYSFDNTQEWDPAPYRDVAADMTLPFIAYRQANQNKVEQIFNSFPQVWDSDMPPLIIPCWKLHYIWSTLARNLGYSLQDQYSATFPDIQQVVIWANKAVLPNFVRETVPGTSTRNTVLNPDRIDMATTLPDMTLGEFLKETRIPFALAMIVEPDGNNIRMKPLKDILTDTGFVDWTDKAVPVAEHYSKPTGLALNWGYQEDFYTTGVSERLTGTELAAIVDVPAVNPGASEGNLRLDLLRDKYYQYRFDRLEPASLEWKEHSFAVQGTYTGSEGNRITTVFQPVFADRYNYTEVDNVELVDNGGNVRLVSPSEFPSGTEAKIVESEYIPPEFFALGSPVAVGEKFAYDTSIIYREDETLTVIFRQAINIILPKVDAAPNVPELERFNSNEKPRMLFYHGMQNRDGAGIYPFGSCGQYNPLRGKIRDMALRWRGPEGLYDSCWKEVDSVLANSRVVEFAIRLDIVDLADFRPDRKVRIRGDNYLVRRIRVSMGSEGIKQALVEMVRVT